MNSTDNYLDWNAREIERVRASIAGWENVTPSATRDACIAAERARLDQLIAARSTAQ